MNYIRHIFLTLAAAAMLFSCSDKDSVFESDVTPGVTLSFDVVNMLPQVLQSRAVDSEPKTAEEKLINTLHLFFFDKDGNFLTANPSAQVPFMPYYMVKLGENQNAAVSIPKDAFQDQENLEGVQIYAVANVICCGIDGACSHENDRFRTIYSTDGKICHGSKDGEHVECTIRNLDDLLAWYYRPAEREDISELPAGGMPMVAHYVAADGEKILAGNRQVSLKMKALMARVDVKVKLEANQTSHDHQLPTLKVTEYGVKNMPLCVPFKEIASGEETPVGKDEIIPLKTVKVNDRTLLDGQEAAVFTYYTYENVRKSNGKTDDEVYPQAVKDKGEDVKQRWKPLFAQQDVASAFVMKGHYITHQSLEYDAQFTVYLGNNVINNFEVRRNCCYKNNISIRGLDYVRNSDPSVYTFDGRVNVATNNLVYLAIVNERKIDAHATALPMDIYFLRMENNTADCHSTVEVELLPDASSGNIPDWIRMESVSAAKMGAEPGGTNSDGYKDELPPFTAGKGARRYFTHDLVTNTLKDNIKITIGNDYPAGTDPDGGNRTRIYFYIDENTPPTEDQIGNVAYSDRTARVKITYNNDNSVNSSRVLEIDQKALLRIDAVHPADKNNPIHGWMEYYEEYVDHKDPLDKHDMPGEQYSGLPWGLDGQETNNGYKKTQSGWSKINSYDVYTTGFEMTKYAIGAFGDIKDVKLFNTVVPESAFHYCAGKNKRNSDGSIYENHWYMPGIRELEVGLTQYYTTFHEFQNDFYWSAAAGRREQKSRVTQEQTDRARATHIDKNGNYVNSVCHYKYNAWAVRDEFDYDDPGSKPRTEKCRIRAFYKR